MERVTLTIQGMTCGHCVNTVTDALKGVDGVKVAKVTLEDQHAEVTYDTVHASVDQMKEAVKTAGYTVA